MEEHLLDRGEDGGHQGEEELCDWAARALQVDVTPHDRSQLGFLWTLRGADTEELRVIASTYEGLDAIAGTHRQAELGWKAAAARAALTTRTRGTCR